ncbi:MAG: TerB family tellurite resistance protein [Alphaproteobacteria bacterium]
MIDRLKRLLEHRHDLRPADHDTLQLAAAALMIEVALMDGHLDDRERQTILDIVRIQFGLAPSEAEGLFEAAAANRGGASDLWTFASVVKARFSEEERIRLVEMLWRVAYADGVLHDYEAHLLRRIAGLIYVSDHERGAARQRVLAALALAKSATDGQ